MINKLTQPYQFTEQENLCISEAKNNWDSRKNCINSLKGNLNKHFDKVQKEKCCYCGLQYDRTGRGEIEHIAPKGVTLYPEFSYTSNNLAKACQLCNSSSMKHTYDTVKTPAKNYDEIKFKIVHPYIDDHDYHYSWKYGIRRVLISVNNNSEEAKESIRLFELASEKRTKARAQQRNQEYLENIYNISDNIKAKIKKVLTFRIL